MINILISNTNLRYSIDLLNIISSKNSNIRVREIAKTKKETIEAINNKYNRKNIIYKITFCLYNIIEGVLK